eukprot:7572-Heterococcus_DN1.PRE.1
MTQAEWDECSKIAHALFAYGQRIAAERGLILVDTKYELGRDAQGNIIVVDEIHTPDSSSDDAAASLTVYSTLRLALCLLAAAVSVLSNCAALPCTLQLGTCFGSNKARMLVSRLMPSHADVLSNCLETSRSHSYEARFAAGEEPDNIDKEFLRKWFAANCDPYNDKTLPEAPADLVNELRLKCCVTAVPLHSSRELLSAYRRYIMLYEMITGELFQFPDPTVPAEQRIRSAVASFMEQRYQAAAAATSS